MYHDGQFNDSRLAVVLACTAAAAGATVANHAEVVRLLKVRGGWGAWQAGSSLQGRRLAGRLAGR